MTARAALRRSAPGALHLFEAVGLELEYMLVERGSFDVRPCAARLVGPGGRRDAGALGWSNELVAHVIELKNVSPTADLARLAGALHGEVKRANRTLAADDVRLMPSAMHFWMDPREETVLWAHGNAEVYRAYDALFDCRAHGWANLQSTHINLPFHGDEEFARLHAAIRLVLPIIPALTASSPYADGGATGWLDFRMQAYRTNAARIPELNGDIIPPPASSRREYEAAILQPMYRAIAPHDPAGVLRHEWLNARGAIARFDRDAIEIRVMDLQECPRADVALAAAIVDAIWMLEREDRLAAVETARLAEVFSGCIRSGEQSVVDDPAYLDALGFNGSPRRAGELWYALAARMADADAPYQRIWAAVMGQVLAHGPLARRLLRAGGERPSRDDLRALCARLCDCLDRDELFAA